MNLSESELDDALQHLPALSLLTDEVRGLVATSFEAVSYSFGSVIVRESEPADAFFLLVVGAARVLKRGANGDEVVLNTLRAGDSFGEVALLEDAPRTATVRASGRVEALRLNRAVFVALTRSHPEVRAMFEAIAKQRALWNFLRVQSSFAELPGEALASLSAGLERVAAAAGTVIIKEGDPPGALYVVEEGRAHASRAGVPGLSYLRQGDFFGERSLFLDEPRAASVEATTDCRLLRFPVGLYQALLSDFPVFREQLEQRIQQYDFQRLSRVPLDFAEEILPAEAVAMPPRPGTPRNGSPAAPCPVRVTTGTPLLRPVRSEFGVSRTFFSWTRWIAGPPAWR